MASRFVFPAKQQVRLESFDLPSLGENDVRLRTICSLMSTGTENIVFNRLFEPGTHWDNWVKYPFYPGYCTVAVVDAVGPKVAGFKPGDRVVGRQSHASHHVVDAAHVYPLPEGIDPREAAWFGLAKITGHGAKAAQFELGDSVLVIGAGPIGQMITRWAAAAGAVSLVVIDPVASRLELARKGGATAVISQSADQAKEAVLAANHGKAPRVVIDSTGHPKVFAAALALAERRGRVVVLGDTGTPSQQQLSSDVITRGLTIVGAHDGHDTPLWGAPQIYRLFFHLVATGRFNLAGINTHTFAPAQCELAYKTANERRGETMGILFDWAKP
ncbi:MAG: zinc-binding alcohol dehydrogenase [Planctomycetota bacterium]|nr:zinc-binding alcohol dehydrogenase [Planctomycetota bacterium]